MERVPTVQQISGFSFVNTQYQRPTASQGSQPEQSLDSVGSSEPGGLTKRPQFASTEGASEGQRRSVSWGRSMAMAFALMVVGAAVGGCATVHRPEPAAPVAATRQAEPPAKQAGKAVREIGDSAREATREWHEKVDKPVAEKAVKFGHWWRDRFNEFKDGVQGK
jgi:hypothetical protein